MCVCEVNVQPFCFIDIHINKKTLTNKDNLTYYSDKMQLKFLTFCQIPRLHSKSSKHCDSAITGSHCLQHCRKTSAGKIRTGKVGNRGEEQSSNWIYFGNKNESLIILSQ